MAHWYTELNEDIPLSVRDEMVSGEHESLDLMETPFLRIWRVTWDGWRHGMAWKTSYDMGTCER